MSKYCKKHLKEGLIQERLKYSMIQVGRVDFNTECTLCKNRAEFSITPTTESNDIYTDDSDIEY